MLRRKFTTLALLIMMSFILAFTTFSLAATADINDSVSTDEGKCTQFFMGRDTVDNGAYLYGRTEDYSETWRKITAIHEAETHAPGDIFRSSERTSTFTWPYPEQTLRYIYSKDSIHNESNYPEPYAEIGMNEMGVTVSSSVTLSSSKTQITGSGGPDRMVTNGLAEVDTTTLVLMQAKTAREGVELLAKIVDTKGAEGREGTVISDPNEVWFFQILSGHQYVGVKCPDNMVGLSPNMTGNVGLNNFVDITDTENFVVSPGLISVAKAAGTFVGSPNDPDPANPTLIKIADSYVNGPTNHQTSVRLRCGYGYLYGYTTQAEINANIPGSQYLNIFVEPRKDRKYSLYEAMRLLAARGEGTEWVAGNPNSNGQAIGNDRTQESHVVEVRSWMAPELATIEWLAQGPAEFSVYLPFMGNLLTDVHEKFYFDDHASYRPNEPYNNNTWHVFRQLYTLCKGSATSSTNATVVEGYRAKYGKGVRDFWEKYQKSLIEQQAYVDKTLAKILKNKGRNAVEKAITEISTALQAETYDYAVKLVAELRAFIAAGAVGNFEPSFLYDETAVPHYAGLLFDHAVPSASVEKLNGNKNNLTVTVTEVYADGSTNEVFKTFSINNNAADKYVVGDYSVYVDTKGNTQIRDCRIL